MGFIVLISEEGVGVAGIAVRLLGIIGRTIGVNSRQGEDCSGSFVGGPYWGDQALGSNGLRIIHSC